MYAAFGSLSALTIDNGLELLILRSHKSLDGVCCGAQMGKTGEIVVVFELRTVSHVGREVSIDDLHV